MGYPTTVCRYDTVEIRADGMRKDARGFLRAQANLTRTGVFEYLRADGTKVREYRSPEEVFKADSLASLRGAPVTDLHPREPVSPTNVDRLRVGGVGDDVRQDGHFVAAEVSVERASSIHQVERGDRAEFSCGYHCRIDATPGVSPEGERYDQAQKDIIYNHVGMGPRGWGRAGRDVALRADGGRVGMAHGWRLDAGDAVLIADVGAGPAQRKDGDEDLYALRNDAYARHQAGIDHAVLPSTRSDGDEDDLCALRNDAYARSMAGHPPPSQGQQHREDEEPDPYTARDEAFANHMRDGGDQ